MLFGFLGLALTIWHLIPFEPVSMDSLLTATETSFGKWGTPILKHLLASGLFWGLTYGAVGYIFDRIKVWMGEKE